MSDAPNIQVKLTGPGSVTEMNRKYQWSPKDQAEYNLVLTSTRTVNVLSTIVGDGFNVLVAKSNKGFTLEFVNGAAASFTLPVEGLITMVVDSTWAEGLTEINVSTASAEAQPVFIGLYAGAPA